jgi:acetylornithine deacetylase/succinyl-diaminopimelate desuccinylase-like protein
MSPDIAAIDAFLTRTGAERLDELQELIRIPTVTVLSEHREDVRAGAEWVAAHMRAIGLEHVEVSETGGHPLVYADWLHAPGAPTVIVYAHYDVQPVDPLDLWVRPPFEPRLADGRIYGRGTADDKGQLHLHLWAARAWLETQGRLPVNVRYVFEGEEEAGSPNFEPWLRANRHRLDADLVVVSDTGFAEGNHPAVTVGLRGNVTFQVDVTGPSQDLHSGSFGGLVQNPANALVRILASLRDGSGRVTVPGFYDEVRDLTPADHQAFAALPFQEGTFAAGVGVPELFGEPDFVPLARRGARPTLDICGMWAGFQGEGSKTIIPAHAHAKLSARVVPDQDPLVIF